MKIKLLYIIFYSTFLFGQKSVDVKIEINSMVDIDSLSFRKYTINYSISNLTNNKISFFLNPDNVIAGSGGSMTTNTFATLFQEKEELPMHMILSHTSKSRELPAGFENLPKGKEKDEILKKYMKEVFGMDIDKESEEFEKEVDKNYRLKKSSANLMKSIMTLEPFETKQYHKTFYWDKKRYYKNNQLEYYIDEKSNCLLEIYIVLLKEEFKERLLESDYTKIINSPNFIKGWFTSNKVEINFRE